MSPARNNERDYFRVHSRVLLGCRDTGLGKPPQAPPQSYFPDSTHLDLLRDLGRIEHEHSHLLHAVAEKDRNLSAYLAAINKKIDTVARHLVAQLPAEVAGTEQDVSLSEGGMSFMTNQALETGSVLALHLTLLPSYVGLASYASVVSCDAADGAYRVSVAFDCLSDTDRQLLARHVMQVQLAQQRRRSLGE